MRLMNRAIIERIMWTCTKSLEFWLAHNLTFLNENSKWLESYPTIKASIQDEANVIQKELDGRK